MSSRPSRALVWFTAMLASTSLVFALAATMPISRAAAQSDAAAETPADQSEPAAAPPNQPKIAKPKKVHARKSEPRGDVKHLDQRNGATGNAPVAAPSTLAAAAATGADKANLDIAAKLTQAGAGACSATIDADSVTSMIGVTQSNTVTTWSNVEPRNKHSVNVFIGQRYGGNQAVPYGVTGLIASPNSSGSCDSTVVQIVTSPLPCANVRDTLLHGGKIEGDLAGISLIRSGQDQTLLMSTATNSCVLVGFHSTFRN